MSQISVIVPVYRAENTISRCVDSILQQSFADFELILVNDCSPDRSSQLCDAYAKTDPRIRVIHKQKNAGPSSARNTGIDAAVGTYVTFCDSDDCVTKDWLEKMHGALVREQADLAICGFGTIVWAHPESLSPVRYEASEYSVITGAEIERFWRRFLQNRNHLVLSSCNKLFRQDILARTGLRFDETLLHSEDALFVFDYVCAGGKQAVVCNDCLYYYSKDVEGSLTRRFKRDYWEVKKQAVRKLQELFRLCGFPLCENDPDLATYWITLIDSAVHNIAASASPLKRREQLKELRGILSSEECASAFAYGRFVDIPKKYELVLRSRSAALVWAFLRLAQWKNTRK